LLCDFYGNGERVGLTMNSVLKLTSTKSPICAKLFIPSLSSCKNYTKKAL